MSCFIVPMVQAVATTVYRKRLQSAGKDGEQASIWIKKLPSLEKMLWGGTVMLVVDHIINAELLMCPEEMLKVGLPISVAVTAVWAIWVMAGSRREQRAAR